MVPEVTDKCLISWYSLLTFFITKVRQCLIQPYSFNQKICKIGKSFFKKRSASWPAFVAKTIAKRHQ